MPNRGNAARHVKTTSPGPWEKWKGLSRPAKYIRFVESFLRSPKGEGYGQLMRLAPFQKDWIEMALADGIDTACFPTPRGNGKSTLAGALACAALFADTETGSPFVPVVAVTMGQAIRSVYSVAASMIRNEPELASRSIEFTGVTQPRIYVPRNEGTMSPISADVEGLQGLDFSFAILDEVGFVETETLSALILASGKRSRSLLWMMGTPGLDRTKALWGLREKVMGGQAPTGLVYQEFAADINCDITDREQWRKANPAIGAGFLRESALVSALETVPASHFQVFRLGLWVDSVESWLGPDGRGVWDALQEPYEFVKGAPTWVGVDAALTRDTTAVVSVQFRPDSRMHAKAKIWVPTQDEPVDITDVMSYIRQLSDTYKLGAVSFDPRFMDWPAKILYDNGVPMVELPQSVERMTGVIGDLYTLIREGGLTHDKDDLFAAHVLNAVSRLNERGFTLSKGKSRGHIDAVIALALAVDRVRNKKKERGKVYVG